MRKVYFLMGLSFLCLPWLCSCNQDEIEPLDGEIVFEILDSDGKPVTELQTFTFGDKGEYGLRARFASYIEVKAPAKWLVEANPSAGTCEISVPSVEDDAAEASGTITFNIRSQAGRLRTVTLDVAAKEPNLIFAFDDPDVTSTVQMMAYSQSKKYTFTSQSVKDFKFKTPAGWSALYNQNDNYITIVAPSATAEEFVKQGTVEVTPVSFRGAVGEPSVIEVALSDYMPSMIFEQETYAFAGGASSEIAFDAINVTRLEIEAPEGWNITPDLNAGKLKVLSPATADLLTVKGGGTVRIKAFNESTPGEVGTVSENYEVFVKLNINGIYTLEDFQAFAAAVETNASLDAYSYQGEVALLTDIDLSGSDKQIFVPGMFSAKFNGYDNTVRIAVVATANEIGLFHTLAATAEIKNLVIEGTIKSNLTGQHYIGGLAVLNEGAPVSGVTADIDFTYEPASWKSDGWYGGLVARTKGAVYTDCHAKGDIVHKQGCIKIFGGLIGEIIESPFDAATGDRSQLVKISDCSNTGNFTLDYNGQNPNNSRFGGIVGWAENWMAEYTNLTNEGNFTITLGITNGNAIHSAGGILGNGYGFFTNCVNRGSISSVERAANRRYGGIVGGVGSATGKTNGYYLRMENCSNYGNLSHTSNFGSGIAGIVENCQGNVEIKNCINYGKISNPQTTTSIKHNENPSQYSGLVTFIKGGTFDGCENHGDIEGIARDRMAGLVGRCQNGDGNIVFRNCKNTGNIKLRMHPDNSIANVSAAGIAVFDSEIKTTTVTFTNCANTGTIDAEIFPVSGGQQRVFHIVSMAKYLASGPLFPGVISMDDATKAYQESTEGLVQKDLTK